VRGFRPSRGFEDHNVVREWVLLDELGPLQSRDTVDHWHSLDQKICIWPSRIGSVCGGRLALNGQGLRYQYLTLEHELAHILNLGDATDSHSALMRSGCAMLELIAAERDTIKAHY
jgi:hypothetical protein